MGVRDPEATKARIFESAVTEFARHGIAGARIDRIAAEAKANKQLIYAYFGNKAELFAIVLEKNTPSINLLKKAGFELWGTLPEVALVEGELIGHVYYGRKV